jgi:hypothetical protein
MRTLSGNSALANIPPGDEGRVMKPMSPAGEVHFSIHEAENIRRRSYLSVSIWLDALNTNQPEWLLIYLDMILYDLIIPCIGHILYVLS